MGYYETEKTNERSSLGVCPPVMYDEVGAEGMNFISIAGRQGNPYSNTYNPGWRNHLNFKYKNTQQSNYHQYPNMGAQPSRFSRASTADVTTVKVEETQS